MNTSLRLLSVAFLAASVVLAAAPDARAHEGPPLRLGQRAFSELGPNDAFTIDFLGLPGQRPKLVITAWKGDTLVPEATLTDPDGIPVDLTGLTRVQRGGRRFRIRGLVLEKAGTYRLRVLSTLGTEGGFDLVTSTKTPKRFRGRDEVLVADEVIPVPFHAFAGDTSKCRVRRAGRGGAKPGIVQYVDASGTSTAIDSLPKAGPFTAEAMGEQRYDATGLEQSIGRFRFDVRVKSEKVSRAPVELFRFLGTISGRVLVNGHGAEEDPAKRASKATSPRGEPEIRSGELVLSAKGGRGIEDALAALHAAAPGVVFEHLRSTTDSGPHLVRAAHVARRRPNARRRRMTRRLAKLASGESGIAWCEPNGIARAFREPNDPLFDRQNDFRQMRLPDAWDVTVGDPSVVVAVIDTGIVASHPDLAGRLVPGFDFISDAGNARDGNGRDSNPNDDAADFHGTHVAGTVGAAGNDRGGVAGVMWDGRILPVRALGADGGTFFDIAEALRWSVGLPVNGVSANANPARVVNMSLGGGFDAQVMRSAVAAATDPQGPDAILVAAAGNENTSTPSFPAAYADVISVAATAPDLRRASYSNFGSTISVAAPGGDQNRGQRGILSTFVSRQTGQPTFRELQGTSMASPHVAGVVGLMLSANSALTAGEVRNLLETTAQDLGPAGFDQSFGFGLVDAAAAVDGAASLVNTDPVLFVNPLSIGLGTIADDAVIRIENAGLGAITVTSATASDGGVGWLSAVLAGSDAPTTVQVTVNRTLLPEGLQRGSVRIDTSEGSVSVPVSATNTGPPDVGTIIVQALDDSGAVASSTTTDAAAEYRYTLEDLGPGSYVVLAFADKNGNDVVDRIDEWFGFFPVASDPAPVVISEGDQNPSGRDFALGRLDKEFTLVGAAGGPIDGALAVWVYESDSQNPVAGARVYGEGLDGLSIGETVTDSSGRAVISGSFTGRQVVTVVADGYYMTTQALSDAQYQSVRLVPKAPPPTFEITLNIDGLDVFDRDIEVQVGDTRDRLVYGGAGVPSITLDVAQGPREVPVWGLVYDDLGIPCKVFLEVLDPITTGDALVLDVTAFEPSDSFWELEQRVFPPQLDFDQASAVLQYEVQLFFDEDTFVPIGLNDLSPGVLETLRWTSFGDLDFELLATIDIAAFDDLQRESHFFYTDFIDLIAPPTPLTLVPTALPLFPDDGSQLTEPVGQQRVEFDRTPGSDVNVVTLFSLDTDEIWTIVVPGNEDLVFLPRPGERGIEFQPGEWAWYVDCFVIPGLDRDDYLDDAFTLNVTDITSSEVFTFSND